MKQRILSLLVLAVMMPLAIWAQKGTARISGTVRNTNGEGLSGVNIYVKAGQTTYGGVSAMRGTYDVEFERADTVTISFSHLGYATLTFTAAGNDDIRRDVTLEDKSIALDEVEVTAKSLIVGEDNVTYIPTKKQVNGANSGIGLLFNMMIPQLDVNVMSGTVSAVDKTSLKLYVDGREADASELSRLRPKDIAKVEYMDHPKGQFAGNSKVVNIVTKKYDSGGYVDARTNTKVIFPSGDYSVQASFDKKKVNILAMAGSSFNRNDMSGSHTDERFSLNTPFTKHAYTDVSKSRSLSDYGLLRTTIRGDRLYTIAQASLGWNETPENISRQRVEYAGGGYPAGSASSDTYSKTLSPSVMLYQQLKLNESNILNWTANYDYSENKYRKNYNEDGAMQIYNDVSENFHSAWAQLNYIANFKHGNSLTISLFDNFSFSKSDYRGTSPSRQKLMLNDLFLYPMYTHRLWNRLDITLRLGLLFQSYRVNADKTVNELLPRPAVNGNLRLNNNSNIAFELAYGDEMPQQSTLNDAEQYVTPFLVTKGNPYLKTGKMFYSNVSYNKYWNNVSLSAYARYENFHNCSALIYIADGDRMIQTYENNKNSHFYHAGLTGMFSMFGKSLQLRLSTELQYVKIAGLYDNDRLNPTYSGTLYYSLGQFGFAGYYYSKSNVLSSYPMYGKYQDYYGLAASWQNKGLFIQLGCWNMFRKKTRQKMYFDYGPYEINNYIQSRNNGANVYVNISYSFDFGRKVNRTNMNVNTSGNSAIMKSEYIK